MSKLRREFEKALKAQKSHFTSARFMRNADGTYNSQYVEDLWEGYQLRQSSVVVNLGDSFTVAQNKLYIEGQGLKVKILNK